MTTFLVGVLLFAVHMRGILFRIFMYNKEINSIILLCIFTGIFFIYQKIFLYKLEYDKLLTIDKLTREQIESLKILRPIAMYVNKNESFLSIHKADMIISSVEKNANGLMSFPKYISGILVFLGLLGTFWGLSHTIGNVANIIDKLGIENSNAAASFLQLKNSLKIPLEGMGIAFGCSLFGLSGSLIIGFLLANTRDVSNNFVESVEEWIAGYINNFSANTEERGYHGDSFSMGVLEKTIETIYTFQNQLTELEGNRISFFEMQKELSIKLSHLTENINSNQDMIRVLNKNQAELQNTIISLIKGNSPLSVIVNKLDAIDASLSNMSSEIINGRRNTVQSLGNDIRMVSKMLSSIIRD
jgi:hypothetical protein